MKIKYVFFKFYENFLLKAAWSDFVLIFNIKIKISFLQNLATAFFIET